ncbi:MAG TPA: ROK family protein [Candidatus Saccharimonadales bacterium]|nr:ROK family protein [Candidatus Saccharimonadales bacterium]
MNDTDAVLSIDTGGTSTRLAVVRLSDGQEICRHVLKTHPTDFERSMHEIATAGKSLTVDCHLVAVGMGVAGVVTQGVLTGSGNLPGWVGRDIEMSLYRAFGVPVIVMNDAQAAGMGEYAALEQPIIYVIWGTGVGAALIVNHHGSTLPLATELGHVVINKKSRLLCGCGGRGHLEAHVGGANIPKRRLGWRRGRKAEHLKDRGWNTLLGEMAIGLRSISTAAPGLPIVLGGGVATKQSHRLPALQKKVSRLKSSCPAPELHPAKHGEDSGLVGAGFAARQLVMA